MYLGLMARKVTLKKKVLLLEQSHFSLYMPAVHKRVNTYNKYIYKGIGHSSQRNRTLQLSELNFVMVKRRVTNKFLHLQAFSV